MNETSSEKHVFRRQKRKERIFIAIGSNVGRREHFLRKAIDRLKNTPDVRLLAVSPFYETAPVGGPKQRDFLNGAIEIETRRSPASLLTLLLRIEKEIGRKRRVHWGPREIDLDLLTMGSRHIGKGKGLRLPHPRYHERAFVLKPLCDIAPGVLHPTLKKTHKFLLRNLAQKR